MSNVKLSIIIVSWNVKPLLERCLDSIFQNNQDLETEIIIVDNSSIDGSQGYLKGISEKRKNLKIILNDINEGFAKANNQALKQASGEYILFLNPDTEIKKDTCGQIIKAMDRNKKWGIVGCRLLGVDGKIQFSVRNFPEPFSQLMILLKLPYLFPRCRCLREYFQTDFDYDKLSRVDQVAGTFMMTKKEIIDKVGGFDERFHLWFEDVDLCYRVKKAGWQIIYFPQSQIVHYGGESFSQLLSWQRQKIYNKSLLAYFKKYYSFSDYWPLIVVKPISLFLAALSEILAFPKKKKIKRKLKIS